MDVMAQNICPYLLAEIKVFCNFSFGPFHLHLPHTSYKVFLGGKLVSLFWVNLNSIYF